MKIVIVDDISLIRVGLSKVLQAAGYRIVGEADTAESAKTVILKTKPDLVVMDYYLVNSTGLDVYEEIKRHKLKTKIIMLTSTQDFRVLSKMVFNTDISAVVKKGNNSKLLEIIEQVVAGKIYIDPAIFSEVIQYKRVVEELSPKQEEILYWIMKGLTNEQISHKLHMSVRSLSNQRAKIRKCINQSQLDILKVSRFLNREVSGSSLSI